MQLHEAAEIIEVLGQTKANALLAEGWKLLAVTTATGNDENKNLYVHYVLGKPEKAVGYIPSVGKVSRKD
ncbi:hypothetical protein [Pseudomonas sp. PICF141]|uniref:hypothetical protein n=1 Tax=Pseudomonas sp. PICF141 TaxID=1949067 RepID=UPI000BABCA82|nr:hypothetical protein [Pseudomonas sp. PICF141]PAU55198.1 hypothetical protein BZL43_19260 [Pseudomonas sp. PICF141]